MNGAKNTLSVSYAPVDSLIPYIRNARTHSDQQITRIAASIREFGFTNPVLIDGQHGIIAGHGRVLAARKLGMAEVPVIELSHLTPAQRKAYIIADNRLALDAGWDDELLRLELGSLKELNFDLTLIGFDVGELDRLFDSTTLGTTGGSASGSLSDKFGVPPFTVLNAREGWWQDRKRAWISIGIKSELGRGAPIGGSPMPLDRQGGNRTRSRAALGAGR